MNRTHRQLLSALSLTVLAFVLAGANYTGCGTEPPPAPPSIPPSLAPVMAKPAAEPEPTPPPAAPTPVSLASFPGTREGARALLGAFVAPGADTAGLSKALRPKADDFKAVFESPLAAKAEAMYTPVWEQNQIIIAPNEGETEVQLFAATTEELRASTGSAKEFPGNWMAIAKSLKPATTWYRFKFVKPAETLGMAFDGLTYVNGHWAVFPKVYRAAE